MLEIAILHYPYCLGSLHSSGAALDFDSIPTVQQCEEESGPLMTCKKTQRYITNTRKRWFIHQEFHAASVKRIKRNVAVVFYILFLQLYRLKSYLILGSAPFCSNIFKQRVFFSVSLPTARCIAATPLLSTRSGRAPCERSRCTDLPRIEN